LALVANVVVAFSVIGCPAIVLFVPVPALAEIIPPLEMMRLLRTARELARLKVVPDSIVNVFVGMPKPTIVDVNVSDNVPCCRLMSPRLLKMDLETMENCAAPVFVRL